MVAIAHARVGLMTESTAWAAVLLCGGILFGTAEVYPSLANLCALVAFVGSLLNLHLVY